LCFQTHRRKKLFASSQRLDALLKELSFIGERHGYHLLERKGYDNNLRCLFSLRPADSISKTLQTIKTNLARELRSRFELELPVWANGFLAHSVGKTRIDMVKNYLASQAEHHGYASRARSPVFRFVARDRVVLTAAHSVFDLSHHVVLSTQYRKGVFASRAGEGLVGYWNRVAAKNGFAIDSATVVPDHVHLLVRIMPKMSIEDCVLSLMNNGQHWLGKHFPDLLVEAGVSQVWQRSAYAGTTGRVTTALIKSFLSG